MDKYVPGTGSESSFGKTYAEVFAPNITWLVQWMGWIGIGFACLSWAGGTLDVFLPGLCDYFLIWGACRVALSLYFGGIAKGIEYQRTHETMRRHIT